MIASEINPALKGMRKNLGTKAMKSLIITVLAAAIALNATGCSKITFEGQLAGDWDCGTYHLALSENGKFELRSTLDGHTYRGNYETKEANGGGHTIRWIGEPNAFSSEHTFIIGPTSDREMAMGKNAGSTGTMCKLQRTPEH